MTAHISVFVNSTNVCETTRIDSLIWVGAEILCFHASPLSVANIAFPRRMPPSRCHTMRRYLP